MHISLTGTKGSGVYVYIVLHISMLPFNVLCRGKMEQDGAIARCQNYVMSCDAGYNMV